MQRLFRLSFLVLILGLLTLDVGKAATVYVSGRVAPGDVRIFQKDSVYIINHDYVIGGTLIIEPGTKVYFHPNGRMIDSVGGRIIADGFAQAGYTANPGGINPIAPGSGFYGYSDPKYFLYSSGSNATINVGTSRDVTVNAKKHNYMFNVVLDTAAKTFIDIVDPSNPKYPGQLHDYVKGRVNGDGSTNYDYVTISFEEALMYNAARLKFADKNVNIKVRPWERLNGNSVNITSAQIQFIGSPVSDFSREWGHIVVLPGAKAAFFRNVAFNGFRKDTTVDRLPIYDVNAPGANWAEMNEKLRMRTNGAGGAITSFSSRTWLLNCEFNNNMARLRGGALQLLQAPTGYPKANLNLGYYPIDKNPAITNKDLTPSNILKAHPVLRIDNIDEEAAEPMNDYDRQAYDDARVAVYLGRMRNLKFDRNYVQLTNVEKKNINGVWMETDDLENAAAFPYAYGNHAFGGAIYVAGEAGDKDRMIEIGLGVNNSIKIDGVETKFAELDKFEATKNFAANYQQAGSTEGARGGAIYVGAYTSLIAAGDFSSNETYVKFMQDDNSGTASGSYSLGGAIFLENTWGRLSIRGGQDRLSVNNSTKFEDNRAGAGGAIYTDGNVFEEMSPVLGGTDLPLIARDFGFDVKFVNNKALAYGGAIYTKRNMSINGTGGVQANTLIGYAGKYAILFDNNTAGYAGGALQIEIPNANNTLPATQTTSQIVRTRFTNNSVGANVTGSFRPSVRGGGAVYVAGGDINIIKAVEFTANEVKNGNGAAMAIINPQTASNRYFATDLDQIDFDNATGLATGMTTVDSVFTYTTKIPADGGMLTRFLDNKITVDADILESQSGSGATQVGEGTPGSTSKLLGTTWLNETTGFAVGYNGTIIKLTNGGTTWQYLNSGTSYRLEDVEYTNDNTIFAAGDRGIVLKSTNAGATWNMLNTGTDKAIHDITFVGTEIGYAVCDGGYIAKTTDAGATWSIQQPGTNNLYGISFTGTDKGYAVGEKGALLVTTNGGAKWDFQVVTGLTATLNNIYFRNASTGFAVGNNGTILMTNNGGDSWDFVASNTTNDLYATTFTGQKEGYIAGQYGSMLKTTDGGNAWSALDTKTTWSFSDVRFPAIGIGYVVGDYGMIMGTKDGGATWTKLNPSDLSYIDVKRYHPTYNLPENGVGLGGAIYILDEIANTNVGRSDSIVMNRVRIESNEAYTGSAIYSDNYDLKIILNRSLITSNKATSEIGASQNVISGAVLQDNHKGGEIKGNFASSDLAAATIYGEIQGPLPSNLYSEAANSIFNNNARFIVRLPDAPNTKGILSGVSGIGYGGTDTLRGNYWGNTEANVTMQFGNRKIKYIDPRTGDTTWFEGTSQETFFMYGDGNTHLKYLYPKTTDPRNQGPFEPYGTQIQGGSEVLKEFAYDAIPLANGADENTVADNSIPEKLLMSGRVYDIYDKGTDIKTADYSKRRMSPIEDYAVGIPPIVKRFSDATMPSNGKYVKRWTRDPKVCEMTDNNNVPMYPQLAALQSEWSANKNGKYYHPVGYPLYLETKVNYDGSPEAVNNDPRMLNQSVFFVINETTGDFIRVNLEQVSELAPLNETFRATVELVPDLSRRNANTLIRRSAAGLMNYGSGPFLLENLFRNPYKEDEGTLAGRKYIADSSDFANVPDLFSNRPSMPNSNRVNGVSNTTFFAGERFKALPVNVGDSVRVISRTVLWREGVNTAHRDGISFEVVKSTEPPVFTGNIVTLQNTKVEEFKNKIFVSEDRAYPADQSELYSQLPDKDMRGRDSILVVSAIDTNKFYDPRSNENGNWSSKYPQLTYSWSVDQNSGLYRWIVADTVAADNQKHGARGYLTIKGKPLNPYVVPGGEEMHVSASNYPPNYRTMDSLRASGEKQDVIDQFIETFPPYLHSQSYDAENARFCQQDTINSGSQYRSDYVYKMFVVDSMPRFIEPDAPADELGPIDVMTNFETRTVEQKQYEKSVYTCSTTKDGKLKANLTDKLRFQVDFNTDDEQEDAWAEATGWNFRFGRTAYGFANTAIRPFDKDTATIDTTDYDGDAFGNPNPKLITQNKPVWMSSQYMFKYDKEDMGNKDDYATDFTTSGKLNIRIPRDEALAMLAPKNQYNGAFNTDTLFTVVVNDGHSGLAYKQMPVLVNVAPEIMTTSIPVAIEGTDYNPQLLDTNKMIKIKDPNFGQMHTFELIYEDETRTSLRYDDCFAEAGAFDLATLKTTPKWLKINKESGILYGTPIVTDAPKKVKATVVVTDEDGLRTYRQFEFDVTSINHDPFIDGNPPIVCVDYGKAWSDKVMVGDADLLRKDGKEKLTLKLLTENDTEIETAKLDVDPREITTQEVDSLGRISVRIFTNNFQLNPSADGKITVKIVATDSYGKADTLMFRLQMSQETDFISHLKIENSKGAFQVLEWGTSSLPIQDLNGVTTGDGTETPDARFRGHLDNNLCEFELPPLPPLDVFDSRWSIPLTNGTLRSIYPRLKEITTTLPNTYIYTGLVQSGGENGKTSDYYPVKITWDTKEIPAADDATRNPLGSIWYIRDAYSNGNLFSFDMKEPKDKNSYIPGVTPVWNDTTKTMTLVINNNTINAFVILYDVANSVENNTNIAQTAINAVTPNPINGSTNVSFSLKNDSRIVMDVIDNLGNVVASIINADYAAGNYTINWNANANLASGSYMIRMAAGSATSVYPVVIIK